MKQEYLPTTFEGKLVHLTEECAEVVKCITKIQRFGLSSKHPAKNVTNVDALYAEMADLQATWRRVSKAIRAKQRKRSL
jgi:hypothetical protein